VLIRKIILAAALSVASVSLLPTAAVAHEHSWHDYGDDDDDWDGDHGRHWGHAYGHYRDRVYYDEPVYYRYDERAYYRDYRPRYRCHRNDTTGLIVGGAAGALIGRSLDRHGDRATGTILGAGAGALLGREVARNGC